METGVHIQQRKDRWLWDSEVVRFRPKGELSAPVVGFQESKVLGFPEEAAKRPQSRRHGAWITAARFTP